MLPRMSKEDTSASPIISTSVVALMIMVAFFSKEISLMCTVEEMIKKADELMVRLVDEEGRTAGTQRDAFRRGQASCEH